MSAVLCNPCPWEELNLLPHIVEAKEFELQESAELIGHVLAKYQVEKLIAVTRLHNHYQLKAGERVMISYHPREGSAPRGFEKNPENVLVKQAVKFTDSSDAIPVNFLMKSDGTLYGTEYICRELADSFNLTYAMNSFIHNTQLMGELVSVMKANNLCDKLGFQLIFEPLLLPNAFNVEGVNLMEDNWADGYQELMYRPQPTEGHKPTITSWRFTKRCGCSEPCDHPFMHGDCDGYCWCLMIGQTGHGGHAWHSNCG